MKIFALAILLLIVGIILISVGRLIITFADPDTQAEVEDLIRTVNIVSTLSMLSLQIGMVLFSFSIFVGALMDKSLSGEVRRGMVLASAIGILGLSIMMITVIVYPYF